MSMPLLDALSATNTANNQRLLGTALAGLLCLASVGCSGKQESTTGSGSAGSGTAGATDAPGAAGAVATAGGSASAGEMAGASASAAGASGSAASSAGGAGGVSEATAGAAGAGASPGMAGAGGAAPELPHITSQTPAGKLTVEDFTALCDERGGTVEVMPHCGGLATAKGFAYDSGTELLSEHTCMGANTCAGWNCVIVD